MKLKMAPNRLKISITRSVGFGACSWDNASLTAVSAVELW